MAYGLWADVCQTYISPCCCFKAGLLRLFSLIPTKPGPGYAWAKKMCCDCVAHILDYYDTVQVVGRGLVYCCFNRSTVKIVLGCLGQAAHQLPPFRSLSRHYYGRSPEDRHSAHARNPGSASLQCLWFGQHNPASCATPCTQQAYLPYHAWLPNEHGT